jgi:hypothetical protein
MMGRDSDGSELGFHRPWQDDVDSAIHERLFCARHRILTMEIVL